MSEIWQELLARVHQLRDLAGAIDLLAWDRETYLPPKGDAARADQLATLEALHHERLTAPELEDLMERAGREELSADQRATVRVLAWERRRAKSVPGRLVREIAGAQAQALTAWREARKRKAFAPFRPHLERLLKLRREQADAIGHGGERYDALLDAYEPGMTVARLSPVLDALAQKLSPLAQAISGRCRGQRDLFAGKRFDAERQWRFGLSVLGDMGFDFEAGRQDRSIHPFSRGIAPTDVRVTTRIHEDMPLSAFFSTVHEGGHALYEQGYLPEHHRTPLASAPSLGLHESQSRFWENIVGRSDPFWRHYLPQLAREFPEALCGVSTEEFLRQMNRVEPSFIRVEADEVTYNLHIALRYGIERALVSGELPVADLPSEWNARFEKLLGVRPPDDLQGVLQDIHWAWGDIGYFPTYTLGNLYSASLWAALRREVPDVEERIGNGELRAVLDWLRRRIHREGHRYEAEELVEKVTGRGLTDEDFLAYLREKYGRLYGPL